MKIIQIERESWPALRFIGKKYSGPANWQEWWANGWFDILESQSGMSSLNKDGYTEAIHIVDGAPEHWLGMLFHADTSVPEGFEGVDMPPMDYAMCYLYGKSEELFGLDAHNQCLAALEAQGFRRKEDDWCLQRCSCPHFTTPDERGNVILDYAISIEA